MAAQKYLCMYRGSAAVYEKPSPAQMQEMFAAFEAWKEKFKENIVDTGSKLKSTGKTVRPEGITDGPFAEGKEVVGGYMVLTADSYDAAVAVVRAMPGMQSQGACIEIREMASY